mgnify:CR=1 FL=1
MIKKLSDDEAYQLLRQGKLARLGCIDEGRPYVVPVNYYWERDSAYIHSLPGRKLEALRDNAAACLQVDDISSNVAWRSVLAFGEYEEVHNENERTRLLEAICDRFPYLTPVESRSTDSAKDAVIFRIRVTELCGVREG